MAYLRIKRNNLSNKHIRVTFNSNIYEVKFLNGVYGVWNKNVGAFVYTSDSKQDAMREFRALLLN